MRSLLHQTGRRLLQGCASDSALLARQLSWLEAAQPVCLRAWEPPRRGLAADAAAGANPGPQSPPVDKQVLYRGGGIRLFRLLVRFKVFQLTGVAAAAIPLAALFGGAEVGDLQVVLASALVVGSGAASTTLWYYSRRYVGELALVQPREGAPKVRLSVLDFWGNREDNDVDLEEVVPPLAGLPPPAAAAVAGEPFLPLSAGDRTYILSLRYGHVVDKEALKRLLSGEGRGGGQGS